MRPAARILELAHSILVCLVTEQSLAQFPAVSFHAKTKICDGCSVRLSIHLTQVPIIQPEWIEHRRQDGDLSPT